MTLRNLALILSATLIVIFGWLALVYVLSGGPTP